MDDYLLQIKAILLHEYSLALYGVILWQVEQAFVVKDWTIKHSIRNVGRSLIWVGVIVVFDDELLAQYNKIVILDYKEAPFWLYIIAGFLIDIVRSYFTKK